MKKKVEIVPISQNDIKSRMLVVRNQAVLLDRDVAALYQVETREVNQAVRNNPEKFPEGFVWELDESETEVLRSKILTLEQNHGRGGTETQRLTTERQSKYVPHAEGIPHSISESLCLCASVLKVPSTLSTLLHG